ncbi:hypothetical protein [Amycolatopsis sp. NPDC051371]|uniref:hypothetical protein n=1 Tax=Amycolatopsis sp. NPDC051371 TaxID=3155800 RepID=UPI003437CD65
MQLVHDDPSIPRVDLMAASAEGYRLLAAEVDRRPPMLPSSVRKRALLRRLRMLARQLEGEPQVIEAAVFDAKFFVPGQGAPFSRTPEDARGPSQRRFDVVVLVRTTAPDHAAELDAGAAWTELSALVRSVSRHTIDVVARNVRRIGDVPHTGGGVFLFNFFDNTPEVLPVWEHSARWFVAKTKLDNSTVLQPVDDTADEYAVINHARWPSWHAFLPHLLLRPSFRRYVGDNSMANGVTAQPILYRQR